MDARRGPGTDAATSQSQLEEEAAEGNMGHAGPAPAGLTATEEAHAPSPITVEDAMQKSLDASDDGGVDTEDVPVAHTDKGVDVDQAGHGVQEGAVIVLNASEHASKDVKNQPCEHATSMASEQAFREQYTRVLDVAQAEGDLARSSRHSTGHDITEL